MPNPATHRHSLFSGVGVRSEGSGHKPQEGWGPMKQTLRMFVIVVACVAILTSAAWAADDRWSFDLMPYVWAVNIDGSATFGANRADFEMSFGDIVDNLDFGGELAFVASYKHFLGFAQMDYVSLSQDFSNGPGGELDANSLFLATAAGYRFAGFTKGSTMGVLGGLRHLRMDSDVKVNGVGTFESTSEITDVIVMLRSSFPLHRISEKMALNLALSIGAGDSDYVWEFQPQLQYQFSERLTGRIGYRRLQYNFKERGVDVDLGFQGFIVGLGVTL